MMAEQYAPVVQLKNLQFSWQTGKPIVDIDELTITQGEKVFIRGPSGSGKTTLLGLLGGVLTPQQGTVTVLNSTISEQPSSRRDSFRANHIGFIFQMFNLIPYLSVIENITLPLNFASLRQHRLNQQSIRPSDEAIRLLTHLGLSDRSLFNRPVTALSMGQQQRAAAARALIGQPEILIADEPTSALDAKTQKAFIQLLFAECKAAGTTLLFVSHDPALETLFDRSIVMTDINTAKAPEEAL
ncbi:ATP-binding cassette domain-containing protein [Candidatus Sororendozoicomonas aggregata]|uniref:ATP-binding cassette domain-containing protein n=1 Tax=Candidatus Sororendozoicomonas aggregata TaxID=3073239 RepID=UPI002ED4E32E